MVRRWGALMYNLTGNFRLIHRMGVKLHKDRMAAACPRKTRMTNDANKELHYFRLAFELAYCIHVNKEVAFFVAEDALDGLHSMLGLQEKNRKGPELLRGFLKWGERTRPIRKTLKLSERQMLQWLVYKESESWERQTERAEGLYLPAEEDLIVRYIEYLVFISLRRGSFYVTLAVGGLLHQFDRRETRLFYDILTQSDSARMKDMSYVGKQRLEVLEKVQQRFGQMIQTAKRPGDEKHFVMRPTTQRVINLVKECLQRFTPWETTCVIDQGFDVTDIPGLYFSETNSDDEEIVEMNRVHTVLDPVCFARFADGLSKYVRTLPDNDPDRGCNYDSPDERLVVPQFSDFPSGAPRGDRFRPPGLTREDYIRVERTLDARAQRRRVFAPDQLCIYIDGVLSYSFDPIMTTRVLQRVQEEARVIEVRGRNESGELTLATLLLSDGHVHGAFKDSVVRPGGQVLTVKLTPIRRPVGAAEAMQLEVSYKETGLVRTVSRVARRAWSGLTGGLRNGQVRLSLKRRDIRWAKAVVAASVIIAVSVMVWRQFQLPPQQKEATTAEQMGQPQNVEQVKEARPATSASPSPTPGQSRAPKEMSPLIARAAWGTDKAAALNAISVETTRDDSRSVDLSREGAKAILSFPLYDDEGRKYSHYRLTLSSKGVRLWQQTLSAPKVSLTGYAHILVLTLFTRRLPDNGPYDLQVEGRNPGGWRHLGSIQLRTKQ